MLTQVAEGVLVHESEFIQSNSVVVQGRAGVLLIDPGITGAEMAAIANDLRELGQPVVAGFSTHPDWDHVLWHAELGDAPRYGTARCAASIRDLLSDADWKARVAEVLPPEFAEEIPSSPVTGPSAEPISYAHGSDRIARTCRPCVTAVFPTTRGSAHRPRWIGYPACMNGNSSGSPKASTTGRPDSPAERHRTCRWWASRRRRGTDLVDKIELSFAEETDRGLGFVLEQEVDDGWKHPALLYQAAQESNNTTTRKPGKTKQTVACSVSRSIASTNMRMMAASRR